ncbi:MAG: molecular chaperone DnaJ [Clostridia bacterium]|nr:molecular chaperone DnaJ [Clostridia bacterium]
MAKDYYKILGVDKKASQDEIKSQYRKLARQYHPDLHPNDEAAANKFKEINEANEVLSDPQKRAQYDYELENPYASGQGGFGGGSGFGDFSSIFDMFTGGFGGSGSRKADTKGADRTIEISISFLDAAKGCTKEVNYSRKEPCAECKGTGAKDGTSFKVCEKCHGTGQIQYTTNAFIFQTVSTKTCPDCRGTGKKIIHKCSKCGGVGYSRSQTKLKFDIPAGADNKSYIKKRGMGDASPLGGEPGDLYVVINVEPHKFFKRKNYDLYLELPISYKTAVMGGKIAVPSIDETFMLDIPEGTQNGKVFAIRGKGIKSRMQVGTMYVTVFIEVPTKLSRAQKEMLTQYDTDLEIKQSSKMNAFKNDVQSLYGVNPYDKK